MVTRTIFYAIPVEQFGKDKAIKINNTISLAALILYDLLPIGLIVTYHYICFGSQSKESRTSVLVDTISTEMSQSDMISST